MHQNQKICMGVTARRMQQIRLQYLPGIYLTSYRHEQGVTLTSPKAIKSAWTFVRLKVSGLNQNGEAMSDTATNHVPHVMLG